MIHIETLRSKRPYPIAQKFEEKGVEEFSLLADTRIQNRRAEVWWYRTGETSHFCVNMLWKPFDIHFFQAEEGDLISAGDLKQAVETGVLPKSQNGTFFREGQEEMGLPLGE